MLEKYAQKNSKIASRIIEEEAVVVLPQISEVNILNKVATRIWYLSDGNRKISEILAVIQDEYNAKPSQIEQDLINFINIMVDKKMLCLCDHPMG